MPKSDPEDVRKSELECQRLASDLMQMAKDTLDADLKAHCLRMARWWRDQAGRSLLPAAGFILMPATSFVLH
jgi:hypothetical protein